MTMRIYYNPRILNTPKWLYIFSSMQIVIMLCYFPQGYRSLKMVMLFGLLINTVLIAIFIINEEYIREVLEFVLLHYDSIRRSLEDSGAAPANTNNQSSYSYYDYIQPDKENTELQWQLMALQGQINPHFLYNTLDSIRSDALLVGSRGIANMTEALARMFRYSISRNSDPVTLDDELQNVNNYLTIQKYRFEERFDIAIEIQGGKQIKNYIMPRMMLQPLVENAVIHSLEKKDKGGLLQILIEETDRHLLIHIRDNGDGIEEDQLKELNQRIGNAINEKINIQETMSGHGVALPNIERRAKLFFGEECGITIYSKTGAGTDCILKTRKYLSVLERENDRIPDISLTFDNTMTFKIT